MGPAHHDCRVLLALHRSQSAVGTAVNPRITGDTDPLGKSVTAVTPYLVLLRPEAPSGPQGIGGILQFSSAVGMVGETTLIREGTEEFWFLW